MDTPAYLDFDLCIERTPDGFRSEVLGSPAGQAHVSWRMPFSELELENFMLRLGGSSRAVRGASSESLDAARRFGARLFETVFDGEVRGCLQSSIDEANERGLGLRIRLRLGEAGAAADLPWEYLYNEGRRSFLTLSRKTPLVRFLDLPGPPESLRVELPLRILTVFSSPADLLPLDVEREWSMLRQSLSELQVRGLVTVERLERPTIAALQDRLRHGTYHVLHFVGHGAYDEQRCEGALFLEDDAGRARRVSGDIIGTLLHDHDPLRLVVLNACEGARSSPLDPLAGVAQCVVRQGVPAVVAMQFAVSDEAAISFARAFYGTIAARYPVDAALAESRKAMYSGGSAEWGTPVLYLRAADGAIFDVAQPAAPLQQHMARAAPTANPVAVPATQPVAPQQPAQQRQAPPVPVAPPAGRVSRWPLACLLSLVVMLAGAGVGVWLLLDWTSKWLVDNMPRPDEVLVTLDDSLVSLEGVLASPPVIPEFFPTPEPAGSVPGKVVSPPIEQQSVGCEVIAQGLNMRRGPGTTYEPIEQLARGRTMLAAERSEDARWVHVVLQDSGQDGWVSARGEYLSCSGEVQGLPVNQR